MDMNNVFSGVNWQEVQPAAGGREIWEEGWTQCVIADSKGAENNQKSGFGLTLYLKAVSGPNNGRTIDHFMNVFHKTPTAQEIGQREFSAYCHATGEFKPVDNHASNLRGKPFWLRTVIEEEAYIPDGKTEAVKTRKSKVKDWDTNNGTKHGAASGNGNGAATLTTTPPAQTAPQTTETTADQSRSNEAAPVQAGWGAPPPSTGAATPPANKAPWNS